MSGANKPMEVTANKAIMILRNMANSPSSIRSREDDSFGAKALHV